MDLGSLNTKTAANAGAWLHLKHPAFGHKLYHGDGADDMGRLVDASKEHKPIRVRVLGSESQAVQEVNRAVEEARMHGETITPDEHGMRLCCAMVTEFEGIERNGQPLAGSDEDGKRAFFLQSDSIVQQVLDFAKNSANFFSAPKAD